MDILKVWLQLCPNRSISITHDKSSYNVTVQHGGNRFEFRHRDLNKALEYVSSQVWDSV